MEQAKKPVAQYYYSEQEWARLGCGPLPEERVLDSFKNSPDKKTVPQSDVWDTLTD